MEGGSLFNPGFLGAAFAWWVGQIVDDSTWRDNINPGKYQDRTSVPGWGRRYKVRIIGLHDQGEKTIPSDQLPWAQVMYPVTAGGGQAGASESTKLRQGNMVFGFFLDGQEQQVPVIMGVLGNNSQTVLKQKNSTLEDSVTDTQPGVLAKSGYSEGTEPKPGSARETPPDTDLSLKPPDDGGTPSNENADGIQQTTVADSRRQAKCEEKIPLMKPNPDEFINSTLKGIQTTIENLTNKIDSILQSLQSYADAITSGVADAQAAIQNAIQTASQMLTKFMKPIFDKIQEFALKQMNKAFNLIIAALPSSFRFQFKDMVEMLTEKMCCMYNKMTDALKGQIEGALSETLNPQQLVDDVQQAVQALGATNNVGAPTNPQVPVCAAESLVARVVALNKDEINDSNNALVDNINVYLEDVSGMLSNIPTIPTSVDDITGSLSETMEQISDILGSMTGALEFTNFKLNVFGCEDKPVPAESDVYTFCTGGDSTAPPQKPSARSIDAGVENAAPISAEDKVPFVEPTKSQRDLDYNADNAARVTNEQRAKSVTSSQTSGPAPNDDLLWSNADQGVSQDERVKETPAEREARRRKKLGDARYEEIQRQRAAAIRAGQEGG